MMYINPISGNRMPELRPCVVDAMTSDEAFLYMAGIPIVYSAAVIAAMNPDERVAYLATI